MSPRFEKRMQFVGFILNEIETEDKPADYLIDIVEGIIKFETDELYGGSLGKAK